MLTDEAGGEEYQLEENAPERRTRIVTGNPERPVTRPTQDDDLSGVIDHSGTRTEPWRSDQHGKKTMQAAGGAS